MIGFKLNGKDITFDGDPETPLLWVVREHAGLTGTKFGCGAGLCGACTLYLDGEVRRSCVASVEEADGLEITTIEGLSEDASHPVQLAWQRLDVPQCGYCQSGMIMAAAALLEENPQATDEDINDSITNLCRCGSYQRVREAIHLAKDLKAGDQ